MSFVIRLAFRLLLVKSLNSQRCSAVCLAKCRAARGRAKGGSKAWRPARRTMPSPGGDMDAHPPGHLQSSRFFSGHGASHSALSDKVALKMTWSHSFLTTETMSCPL